MTFVRISLRRSGKPLQRNVLMQNLKDLLALQALLFPLRRRLLLVWGLLRKSHTLWLPLLPPFHQKSGLRGGGGGLGMHLVLLPVGLPLLLLDLCPERGVEVLLDALLLHGLWLWKQLARSGRLFLSLSRLPLPAHLCMVCKVMSRESLRRPAPVIVPPVLPDLRLAKHGRIVEPVCGRAVLVAGLVACAFASLPVRGREHRERDSS